ncbi:hypothetical protein [Kurthia sibirica]|uniref:Uncharacterized protein n=1 Tax=Kurthia sibirica TaxID=202750 RepID=A0A2U3AE01_9BACL|nr:hypothetical protein [Kurthia sibirica]PWI22745.1 hypothetical protein DEX24_16720 [Kurthia sibirica]GEK35693.1 hypothetical protein KSI01_32260 [Kurthia sibirica]
MATTFSERVKEIFNDEFEIKLNIPPKRKITQAERKEYQAAQKSVNAMLRESESYKEHQKELSVLAEQLKKDCTTGIGAVDMDALKVKYLADKALRENIKM